MERSSQYLLVSILLLLPMFTSVMGHSNMDIHTDTSALIAFKSQIKPDPQNFLLKNWTTETSVCSWVGVSCDSRHNRVSELNISFMGLAGTIPSEIGNLSFLVSLDITGNFFHGPIPPFIFTMPKLQVLVLEDNSLSSSLPHDMCKHGLQNLKTLQISYNELYGEIPSTVGQCSQLEYLSLFYNNFAGRIPSEIGDLTLLQELDLGVNYLSGPLPSRLGNLSNMESLDLYSNKLNGELPPSIWNLPKMRYLSLSSNELKGEIPPSICNMAPLQALDLSNNNFQGTLPQCFGNLSNMDSLYLHSNKLNGELPSSICNMAPLQNLLLSNNNFQGTLPQCFGNLSNMQHLLLSSNKLNGEIPPSIWNLPKMRYLKLSSNELKGEIPPSICKLESLQYLLLSHNSFDGSIPQCFVKFKIFHVNRNNIRGVIPSSYTEECGLFSINLNGNKLEGPLPLSLNKCKNLEGFDVGNNEIEDVFPFWMESLPQLRVLVLRSNKFHGTVSPPQTELPFPKLQVFDISRNAFTGSLPDAYFKNFRAMIDVKKNETEYVSELSYYFLQLTITFKGVDQLLERLLTALTTIDLSSNNFSGRIPDSIGNLQSLKYLNFSCNKLVGNIPASVGNMSALESLDFSTNRLEGEIPTTLTRLTFLESLNLSLNNLVGQVPESTQLDTFGDDSFIGNLGLCGAALTRKCSHKNGESSPAVPEAEGDGGFEFVNGFGWQSVALGYGCGFVVGIGMGYCILRFGRPKWFLALFFGYNTKMKTRKRHNRAAATRRRGG